MNQNNVVKLISDKGHLCGNDRKVILASILINSNWWSKPTKNNMNSLSANTFPRQSLLPMENGTRLYLSSPLHPLFLPINLPFKSRKRPGLNWCEFAPQILIHKIETGDHMLGIINIMNISGFILQIWILIIHSPFT